MRARSSAKLSSLLVVVSMLASGCSPDGEPAALAAPEPEPQSTPIPAPEPTLEAGPVPTDRPSASPFGIAVRGTDDGDIGDVATPVLRRLVYQCSDEVTFAVRRAGDRLEVIPPGVANSYVVLTRLPSDAGVRFTAPNADFRANGDLATLQIGRNRYVDCVSNPAAGAWGTVPPSAIR